MFKVVTAFLVLAGTAIAHGQTLVPAPSWAVQLAGADVPIVAVWSPTGSCAAVATQTAIHVIDVSGSLRWTWDFRVTSRYLHVNPGLQPVALSPRCDVIALAGGVDYRYVWTADESGGRFNVRTRGTPLAVAFSLDGNTVAVATGASLGYLLSPHMNLKWSGGLGDLPARWPGQRAASGPNVEEFDRANLNGLLGRAPWGYYTSDDVSDDGEWRIVNNSPFLGLEPRHSVTLWGPGARGFHGRWRGRLPSAQSWRKEIGCPRVEISRDGEFVVVLGILDHPEFTIYRGMECFGEDDPPLHVFDRKGTLVLSVSAETDRDELSQAVETRTGKPLVFKAPRVWSTPPDAEPGASISAYSPDLRMLLSTSDSRVRLYKLP